MSELPPRRRCACIAAGVLASTLLSACASHPENPTVAYRNAESVESLAVPPDLTKPNAPGALTLPDGERAEGARQLLPRFQGIRFVRAGESAWLELANAAPDEVWPRLGSFVRAQGLQIAEADPALGIVETEWAERLDGPGRGGLTGFFDSMFGGGAEPVHDRYHFALERMDSGGTRVLVAHRSAQEVARAARQSRAVAGSGADREFGWERSGGDPVVRAEMTKRLLVHLGMAEERAQGIVAEGRGAAATGAAPQYFESDSGRAWMIVDDRDVRRVFARVEQALTEIDAEIDESAFDQRRLRVRWAPPNEDARQELTVHVRGEDGATRVTAGDAAGSERSGASQKALLRELTAALGGDPGEVRRPEPEPEQREPGRPRSPTAPRR